MKIKGNDLELIRIFDNRFVRLLKDGKEIDFGFVRADIASERGFEIARNGTRHYVRLDTFDTLELVN